MHASGQLAVSLRDSGQRDRVVAAVTAGPVGLATVRLGASFATSVRAANTAVHAAKGLPGDVSLLQVRLAHPDMLPVLRRGAVPVVAATPTDDTPTSLIGYDPAGRTVRIAAAHAPQRPVLLVEVDTAKAMPLGIEVVRQRLGGAGTDAVAAATGYWATKVTAIRLSNDQEPWFKGGAEIYSIVDAILAALPSSWYTDDPDYVDSWYTLSTASSGHLTGAAGNGWMGVTPYFVQPL
ncbi:DUF3103 family protein [Dactylosporangium sp. NPDC049742]|uniref:DUF3103 family protein n=1 Tax=Dactylosporangium sp. NPDC049742 TaxID=3154737 RepID=UPI003448F491